MVHSMWVDHLRNKNTYQEMQTEINKWDRVMTKMKIQPYWFISVPGKIRARTPDKTE